MQKSPDHGKKPGQSRDPRGRPPALPPSYSINEVYGPDGELQKSVSMANLSAELKNSLQKFEKHSQTLV